MSSNNLAKIGNEKIANYACKCCQYITSNKTNFLKHNLTLKHKKSININFSNNLGNKIASDIISQICEQCPSNDIDPEINIPDCENEKNSLKNIAKIAKTTFFCNFCNYSTKNSYDYKKHTTNKKHLLNYDLLNKKSNNKNNNYSNVCLCGKSYKDPSGLWRHSKKCEIKHEIQAQNINIPNTNIIEAFVSLMKQNQEFKELMLEQNEKIMEQNKQNQEFQKQLLEVSKEGKHIINNTTNNNNFNLNVFLNETCKDALNMMEFVKSMNLQLVDLEETGKLGYSGGMSRIFINGLKELDVNKRPIHCSDLKREILYIKEDNVWEKDNEERTKIKKAIREIEHKNIKQIPLFVKEHPNCIIGTNRENTPYLKMVMQSTGGIQSDEEVNINKIITNIAKEVVINKF
jgi:hypothetical protein